MEFKKEDIIIVTGASSGIGEGTAFMQGEEKKYPMGYGEVSNVAKFITYLISDKTKWITSPNYIIDCGVM